MSGFIGFLKRNITLNNPPSVDKDTNALRFGILGAARIGPDAVIKPAKSHPSVVVAAVASRDRTKADRYAKQHSIPKVFAGSDCYHKLVDDPEIDVIYNALPNGLHYEWTMRALQAGKHVLVEKPCANTAAEARTMFEYAASKGLVLLEGYHYRFYPAIQRAKEIVESGELGKIKSVYAELALPKGFILLKDDIRWDFNLGGGATMDMGVYTLSSVRYMASSNPLEVLSATPTGYIHNPTQVDSAIHATYSFPSSITAETLVDFQLPPWGPFHLLPRAPKNSLTVKLEGGEIHYNLLVLPHIFHSIKVKPTKGKSRVEKVYKFKDGSGEEWWSTYRYQLQAFVDQVRGRQPQAWITAEESITQMEWIEKIYTKAGLPVRPASSFTLSP